MPYAPIALSQTKKEARIFMYVWFGNQTVANLLKEQDYLFNDLAIVDEKTGDQYVCRSVDYSYFKYVKDETVGNFSHVQTAPRSQKSQSPKSRVASSVKTNFIS